MNLHLLKSSCKSCTARLAPNQNTVKAISLLDPAVVFSAETLSTTRTGEEDDDNSDKDEAGEILQQAPTRLRKKKWLPNSAALRLVT